MVIANYHASDALLFTKSHYPGHASHSEEYPYELPLGMRFRHTVKAAGDRNFQLTYRLGPGEVRGRNFVTEVASLTASIPRAGSTWQIGALGS